MLLLTTPFWVGRETGVTEGGSLLLTNRLSIQPSFLSTASSRGGMGGKSRGRGEGWVGGEETRGDPDIPPPIKIHPRQVRPPSSTLVGLDRWSVQYRRLGRLRCYFVHLKDVGR